MILLSDITKIYGKGESSVKALNGINLEIQKGEMVAIMGSSGSGKSTLLNIIGCIDKPTSGTYYLNGKDVSKMNQFTLAKLRNQQFGFVVQHFALIDDYSVFQNIKIPLDYTRIGRSEKKKRIYDILDKLSIKEKVNKYPNELSGGQCQRVAITRALVNEPEIILADEPTGALDQKTGKEIMDIFVNLNLSGKTVVIITHDFRIADYCNKKYNIEDGKILHP